MPLAMSPLHRTQPPRLGPATSSRCTSSRSGDAHGRARMTGRSVHSPTQARRLAGETPACSRTAAPRAPISARALVAVATRASGRTASSSAGYTPRGTERRPARMAPLAAAACVSSPTCPASYGPLPCRHRCPLVAASLWGSAVTPRPAAPVPSGRHCLTAAATAAPAPTTPAPMAALRGVPVRRGRWRRLRSWRRMASSLDRVLAGAMHGTTRAPMRHSRRAVVPVSMVEHVHCHASPGLPMSWRLQSVRWLHSAWLRHLAVPCTPLLAQCRRRR